MKKIVTIAIVSIMATALLTACSQSNEESTSQSSETTLQSQETLKNEDVSSANTSSNKVTFETTDIKGNAVTSDVFKDYDLTMINVWGTGCVPCIEEMPGLAKFSDQLPENVNMLSICVDYDADPAFAEDILTQSNANFTTLKVSDSLFESVLVNSQALPTTLFVDKEGNVVGDIIQGAPAVESDDKVLEHYMSYVNERLGDIVEE